MAWPVGMKVECVYDDVYEADGQRRLFAGRTYTVRQYLTDYRHPHKHPRFHHENAHVRLAEICGRSGGDQPYAAGRFRPVVERKTDISIFTRMLQPAKKAAETVGFLAFMAGVCIAIEFAQFWRLV